jgi:hypothetical protein
MAVLVLAPDLPRLANLFVLNRSIAPSKQPQLFSTRRANRIALSLQILIGVWVIGRWCYHDFVSWRTFSGRPRSPLYGIWNVEQFSVDTQVRPPLLTDNRRWRRIVLDDFRPDLAVIEQMDNSFTYDPVVIDTAHKTLVFTKFDDKSWRADFKFDRPKPDQLVLEGSMDGHKIQMQLQLFDRNNFLLVNRGFHWIQEYPFNR